MYHNSEFQLWVAKAYEKTSDAVKEWIYTILPPIHMLTTAEKQRLISAFCFSDITCWSFYF